MNSDRHPTVAPARHQDLAGILEILNHYIAHDHCTFDTDPWSLEQKQPWFDGFASKPQYRLLVARQGPDVLGYAHSGQWRNKHAYDITVETTVYVAPQQAGRGLGRSLLGTLLNDLEDTPAGRAVAGIAQPNVASNRLHESLGFEPVGTFHKVGHKFDQYWDVRWFERAIP